MDKFEKHPVDVYKNRKLKISRIHALELARRALEAGSDPQAPLTNQEAMMTDPTSQWPQMIGAPQAQTPFSGTPFEGM